MNPEEVVRAEMAAWDHLDVYEALKYFAQDAVDYIGPSYPRLSGHDAIRKTLHAYFNRATECDLKILHLAVDGDVVLMERFDHWIVNGKPIDTAVMGGLRGQGPEDHSLARVLHPARKPLTVYAVTYSGHGRVPVAGASETSKCILARALRKTASKSAREHVHRPGGKTACPSGPGINGGRPACPRYPLLATA